MSLVVPLANSLTFVFTAVTCMLLGEAQTHNASPLSTVCTSATHRGNQPRLRLIGVPVLSVLAAVWLGMALIVAGTAICLASKEPS